jgi:hypothetical protein
MSMPTQTIKVLLGETIRRREGERETRAAIEERRSR